MDKQQEGPKCEYCGSSNFQWEVFSPIDTVETAICKSCHHVNWDIKKPCEAYVDVGFWPFSK